MSNVVPVPIIDPIGYSLYFPDFQPFSARAGVGYQELLEGMRYFLERRLSPYLTQLPLGLQDQITGFITTINTSVDAALAAEDIRYAQTLAEIIAGSNTGLNSGLILEALQAANSTALAYLDGRYDAKGVTDSRYANTYDAKGVTDSRYDTRFQLKVAPMTGQAHSWNPSLHLYNEESPQMALFRKRIARSKLDGLFSIGCIGDSKTAGFGTNGGGNIRDSDTMPGQLRSLLGAGEGMSFANTFHGAGISGIDLRWSGISGLSRDTAHPDGQALYLRTTPGIASACTATFITTEQCDGVSVYAWGGNAPVITVTIDGVANAPVTISNAVTWTKIDYTGLAVGIHTVKIDSSVSTTQNFALLGVKPARVGQNLTVTNAGICSANASLWISNPADFSAAYQSAVFTNLNGAVINLGTNADPNTVAALTAICNGLRNTYDVPVLLVMPGTLDNTYDTLRAELYELANTLNLPLLDFADLTGYHAAAAANDLVFDILHENGAGYAVEAAAVKAALLG